MILYPKFADTIGPSFAYGINTYGINLCQCDTAVQKSIWVPAKYSAGGALDPERKNAHDLALLSVIQLLKTLWHPQEKWSPQLPAEVADLITRKGGYGCYVMMWGAFGRTEKSVDLWGVLLMSDACVPLHHVVCKHYLNHTQQQRKTFMESLCLYFTKGDFFKDYAAQEGAELMALTEELARLHIQPQSFRLISRHEVADPVPAELLCAEKYHDANALSNSLLAYRRSKPSLLKKICGAIFVAPNDFKKARQAGISPKLIRICS